MRRADDLGMGRPRWVLKMDNTDAGSPGRHAVASGAARPARLPRPLCKRRRPPYRRRKRLRRPDTSPLARFVPKENLVAYFEFSGLDSHEAAWKNTASYKMLTDTTLGEMLGMVVGAVAREDLSIIPTTG